MENTHAMEDTTTDMNDRKEKKKRTIQTMSFSILTMTILILTQ